MLFTDNSYMYLWWSLCNYLVFTRVLGENNCRRLSSLLCLCGIFRELTCVPIDSKYSVYSVHLLGRWFRQKFR